MTILQPHPCINFRRTVAILLLFVGICLANAAPAVRYPRSNHRTRSDISYLMRYRGSLTLGYLNHDDKMDFYISRPVVLGGTVAVEFLPTGRWKCLQEWNNASIGLALTAVDLGHNKFLGQAIAPHAYFNIPLVNHPRAIFGLRPGAGVGFVTRTYANTVPDDQRWKNIKVNGEQIANASIGSIANAFMTAGFYFDFPFGDNWDVTLSFAWQHLSNASIMTPNGGYNMFNAEIGMAYTPKRKTQGFHHWEPDPLRYEGLYQHVKKKWGIELLVAGGVRSVYYKDRDWFGTASVSLSGYWQPLAIFRLGIGADFFYDGAYAAVCDEFAAEGNRHTTYFSKTYLSESRVTNCLRAGVSLQPECIIGNFTFGYHIGLYLYDPVKNLEPYAAVKNNGGKPLNRGIFYAYNPLKSSTYQDGWCYQKIQLRYYCSEHFFFNLGLKLHFFKAENLDFGIGFRFT